MQVPKRLLLDSVILAAFILAYYPNVTGLALHEWMCLAALAPTIVHLVINWDWVVRTVTRFARRLATGPRINLIVDALLLVAFVTVMLSGFMVSRVLATGLGIAGPASETWHALHSLSADAIVALTLAHAALHWRWIARAMGIDGAKTVPTSRPAHHPVPTPAERSLRGATR